MLVFALNLWAQTAQISGKVFKANTREPLAFATVQVLNTELGAVTDEAGVFKLELPAGIYNLKVSYAGHASVVQHELPVRSAQPMYLEFELVERELPLDVVEVKASSFQRTLESPLGLQRISLHELERMPGATLDVSNFLKTLPGVSPTTAFGYNIIVRGGASNENRFYLDGIEIPTITHFTVQGTSGGPNGMLNVRMLEGAELHTGAFPASRPNALSSVLEIHQREGRKDRFGANFTLGATDWGFLLEGPMGKKSSYMLSARESFSQHLFRAIGLPVIPTYSDLQYKQVIRFDARNELTLTGIGAYDKYELNVEAEASDALLYNVGYIPEGKQWVYAGGAVYKHYLENSYYTVVLSRSYFNNQAQKFLGNTGESQDQILDYRSIVGENKLRIEQKLFRGQSTEWSYGINAEQNQVETDNYSLYSFRDGSVDTFDYSGILNMVRYGAFVNFGQTWRQGKVGFSAGLRMDGSTYNSSMQNPLSQLSPRLAAHWQFADEWRLNASTGLYYQLPDYVLMTFKGDSEDFTNRESLRYIRSAQAALGVEHSTAKGYQVRLEGFYKHYSNYPFLLFDSISFANSNEGFVVIGNQAADASSNGQVYGLEFQVQQKFLRSYYWGLAYTYVVSKFGNADGELVSSAWDNRHFGTLTAGKTFRGNWQLGLRWSLAGGSPYTPYDVALSSQRRVWDINQRGLPDYNQLNEARLPTYHQMDVRVDKQFAFQRWSMTIFVDVQNIYRSPVALLPYLTVQRGANQQPLVDPMNSENYLTQIIASDTGRILPFLGFLADF